MKLRKQANARDNQPLQHRQHIPYAAFTSLDDEAAENNGRTNWKEMSALCRLTMSSPTFGRTGERATAHTSVRIWPYNLPNLDTRVGELAMRTHDLPFRALIMEG